MRGIGLNSFVIACKFERFRRASLMLSPRGYTRPNVGGEVTTLTVPRRLGLRPRLPFYTFALAPSYPLRLLRRPCCVCGGTVFPCYGSVLTVYPLPLARLVVALLGFGFTTVGIALLGY